jgi:hypothetical protein
MAQKTPIVAERHETVRKDIVSRLDGRTLSAKEISGAVGVREKEVYEHLDHIRKSLERGKSRLKIHPAECKKCGFVFKKRERIKKPGKCPLCHGQSIDDPLFSIEIV